jgi:hypothetical protein
MLALYHDFIKITVFIKNTFLAEEDDKTAQLHLSLAAGLSSGVV